MPAVEDKIKLEKNEKNKVDLTDPTLYINRELSQLEFQRRVLEEAYDETNPLLERVKFLAIVGSNLDEFFMVRVAGLKRQIEVGVLELPPDGITPAEQLVVIRKVSSQLMIQGRELLRDELLPRLNQAGVHILNYAELNDKQLETVKTYFNEVVFPVLTPLAFDPGHPFPHISNLSLNLAVMIRDKEGKNLFARIKVPNTLPRLVPIKRSSGSVRRDGTVPYHHYFVWLEQVIAANLDVLFPGMKVVEAHPFRVTRDADTEIQELEASDLLETMEQSMRQRRFGSVVRLTVNEEMPAKIREILIHNLELDHNDIYTLDGPLGISDLSLLYQVDRYDLKDIPFKQANPNELSFNSPDANIYSVIRKQDILLHHPYDSFLPVVEFLLAAARDPDVLAIKQTLYRVGKNPPVVTALLEAVQNGKQVAVLLELKARFDEESNIGWAKKLESAGVHVIYGLLGLKTHSKVALVIRKEGDGIRRYIHLATGNYNAITAQLYEDLGMFTCDDDMGADATDLFNYLTGYSEKKEYRKLLVAPINLRSRLEELVQREIEHQKRDKNGHLIFKVNAIVDQRIIRLLYEASMAGVKIDLIVRSICCLRPGLEGISENIRVVSIVGRFLEHSRIYYFHNGGNEEIYMGSADLMPRNIDRRVEVLFPVEDVRLIRHLRDDVLETYMKDNRKSRLMLPDGSYKRLAPREKEEPVNVQDMFIASRQSVSKVQPGIA
ncbi:MAG: polyphosphate kinase 1 [Chloroflexi bacterium]|nr:MAG: polyphosphate kinase 1 [Chloroflexota bacterium]